MSMPAMTVPRRHAGFIFWGIYIAAFMAISLVGNSRSVTPAYRTGALAWSHSEALYSGTGGGFIYLPQAAILFVPFTWLPYDLGEAVWRMVSIGMFAWGLMRLAGLMRIRPEDARFVWLSALAGLMAFDSARNGQATLLMSGLMMLALADIAEERFSRAACWICLGFAVKPLILVLILLLAALYRRLTWRLAVGMLVVVALPFVLQNPHYVLQQYQAASEELRIAADLGDETYWANLFGALKVGGLDIGEHTKLGVRLAAALGTLALAFGVKRQGSAARTSIFLYSISAAYILLFNPRTENNTYALLGPAIALAWANADLQQRKLAGFGLIALALGTVGSWEVGRHISPPGQAVWLAPLCCAAYAALLAFNHWPFAFRRAIEPAPNAAPLLGDCQIGPV